MFALRITFIIVIIHCNCQSFLCLTFRLSCKGTLCISKCSMFYHFVISDDFWMIGDIMWHYYHIIEVNSISFHFVFFKLSVLFSFIYVLLCLRTWNVVYHAISVWRKAWNLIWLGFIFLYSNLVSDAEFITVCIEIQIMHEYWVSFKSVRYLQEHDRFHFCSICVTVF